MRDLGPRVVSSLVFVPVFFALAFLGGWPFLVFSVVTLWVISSEMGSMAPTGRRRREYWVPLLLSCALLLSPFLGYHILLFVPPLLLLTVVGWWFAPSSDWQEVAGILSWRTLTAVYVGLVAFWPALRGLSGGQEYFLFALLCTWMNDTAAYFVGSTWGAQKLVPQLSPGKSRMGAAGGAAAGIAVGIGFALFVQGPVAPYAGAGFILAVAAQLGDLFESMLKRGAGVKDAGSIIPGHGGVLDRIDGLLFAVPTLVLLVGLGLI